MKYLLIADENLAKQIAPYIIREIERHDVRAEIKLETSINLKKKAYDWFPDIVLQIGTARRKKNYKHFKKGGSKLCYLSLERNNDRSVYIRNFDLILNTLPDQIDVRPTYSSHEYVGHPMIDLVRLYEFTDYVLYPYKQNVVIIAGSSSRKSLRSLLRSLSTSNNDINFIVSSKDEKPNTGINVDSRFKYVKGLEFELLKDCNACIVFDDRSSLLASFINSPQVMVKSGSSFFKKSDNPLLNELLGRNLMTPLKPSNVMNEVNRLINDHEYSASILNSYQELREVIGAEPCFRKIGRVLIDFVEDN